MVTGDAAVGSHAAHCESTLLTNQSGTNMVLTTFMLPAGYHQDGWRMDGSRSEELGNIRVRHRPHAHV